MEKPEKLKQEHLTYLDQLRESGITNMYGAVPYLMNAFPELKKRKATEIVIYWMKIFSERKQIPLVVSTQEQKKES